MAGWVGAELVATAYDPSRPYLFRGRGVLVFSRIHCVVIEAFILLFSLYIRD